MFIPRSVTWETGRDAVKTLHARSVGRVWIIQHCDRGFPVRRRMRHFVSSCRDSKGANNFSLRVKGDSMEPEFNEGDIIIVSPHAKPATGDYIVAKNDEEETTFKQYKKFDNTRVLHPLNPKYPDIVLNKDLEYRIVGVVMEKKRYK